ncbi:MAG: choice-of-anchor tandem repeat GloVer-containing protein, partial [Edaphobacter sp.]
MSCLFSPLSGAATASAPSAYSATLRIRRISWMLTVLLCAVSLWTVLSPASLRAQTSTNLPTPVALSGVLQGSDGNYYSPTANNGREIYCWKSNGGYNLCGALYQTPTTGPAKLLFDFSPALITNGSAPNPLIEGPDGNFYGTTTLGGPTDCDCGVFFKIDQAGTFTILHTFERAEFQQTEAYRSGNPIVHLVLGSDGNFYGFSAPNSAGAVFKLTPSGDFSLLVNFWNNIANGGGFIPSGLIEASDGNFYISVQGYSGSPGNYPNAGGFIYRMTPSGTSTLVASFPGDGSLGFDPNGDLAQGPDGSIYGVTRGGGDANALPTIYKYTPGGAIQTLYTFPATGENGKSLLSGLILGSDGYLYGTSPDGSSAVCYRGCGTAFRISTTGNFSVIHAFQGGADGGSPSSPIIQSSDGTITG